MVGRVAGSIVLFSAIAGYPASLNAQERPEGVIVGPLVIAPALDLSLSYDDNVFAEPDDAEGDLVFTVSPGLRIANLSQRYQVEANFGISAERYRRFSSENDFAYGADVAARVLATQRTTLTGSVAASRQNEDRGDTAANRGREEPARFTEVRADLGAERRFPRAAALIEGSVVRVTFDDEADRDRDRLILRLDSRFSYSLSPPLSVFVAPFVENISFTRTEPGQPDDSALAIGTRLGAAYEQPDLWTAEIGLGPVHQRFDDPTLGSNTGLTIDAALDWQPTRLTTVAIEISRDVVPTTEQGSLSQVETVAGLSVSHQFDRDIVGEVRTAWSREEFQDIDRTDDTLTAGVGVRYALSRNIALVANWSFETNDSTLSSEDFQRNLVSIGISAQL
jgi:hypothetical protein